MNNCTTIAATDPLAAARFDIYCQSHKALRACFSSALDLFGRLDCSDDQATMLALDELDMLLDHCGKHLDNEDQFVHPALDAAAPGASSRIASEHEEHRSAIAALRAAAEQLALAPTGSKEVLAAALYRRLASFVAENLLHMEHEESVNNALLWASYIDSELAELHAAIVAATPPADLPWHARWLAGSLRPSELAALFGGLQASMPTQAFGQVAGLLRPHLDPPVWQRLATSFGLIALGPGHNAIPSSSMNRPLSAKPEIVRHVRQSAA